MGQDWIPNRAVLSEIMTVLLLNTEQCILDSTDQPTKFKWLMVGGYFCVCYVVSLRSLEGLLCDLEGLIEYYSSTRDHVIISLLAG